MDASFVFSKAKAYHNTNDFIHPWQLTNDRVQNLHGVVVGPEVAVDLGFTTLLTSQVISAVFCSERKKSDKFCSEALISAWSSIMCRKSTTRDPWLYFPSEGSHTQHFYALKKSIDPGRVLYPRTSDPVASTITMEPPGSTNLRGELEGTREMISRRD